MFGSTAVVVTVLVASFLGWRAGKMRYGIMVSGGVVLAWIAALFVVMLYFSDEVDRCVDHGGRWNEKLKACEGERSD